jgi:hypothetical protein
MNHSVCGLKSELISLVGGLNGRKQSGPNGVEIG